MVIKLFTSALLVFFLAACSTTPKDTADSSGSGSSSSSSDVSSNEEGTITETSPESASITPGSQEDLIVNVGDRVFFNYDSSDLDSDAQELLQDQVAWLKQYSDVSVIVEGHCDERGTREYNLALGEKRAQSVKNYLISLGISSDRISTISYGKERPAVVGSNDGAWAQNRRSVSVVN
jgi:peptidoglycan-associated lipoprotein